jgi:hypothetical protein
MIIKKHKSSFNPHEKFLSIKDGNIEVTIWCDQSGSLSIKNNYHGDYYREDGLHKHRVADIKRLAKFYTTAYKTLLKINKKLKQINLNELTIR